MFLLRIEVPRVLILFILWSLHPQNLVFNKCLLSTWTNEWQTCSSHHVILRTIVDFSPGQLPVGTKLTCTTCHLSTEKSCLNTFIESGVLFTAHICAKPYHMPYHTPYAIDNILYHTHLILYTQHRACSCTCAVPCLWPSFLSPLHSLTAQVPRLYAIG